MNALLLPICLLVAFAGKNTRSNFRRRVTLACRYVTVLETEATGRRPMILYC